MPRLKNSLSLQVMLAYVVGVALSVLLIVLGVALLVAMRTEILDKRVAVEAQQLAEHIRFDQSGSPTEVVPSDPHGEWLYSSFKDEMAYRVLDASGQAVLHSPAGPGFWPDMGQPIAPAVLTPFRFERSGVQYQGASHALEHGGKTWTMQFASSVRASDLFRSRFALPFVSGGIAWFSAVLLLVFGACAYVTIGRTFKPLRDLSASAAAISPRSLHARLSLKGVPEEVAPLVTSFNRALDTLEEGYRVQADFMAAAAHELKTPLALMRAQVELGALGEDRDALLTDIGHMTRQVQQLLLLAETSEVRNYRFEDVDVAQVAFSVSTYLDRMARTAEVELDIRQVCSQPVWRADRAAAFTLLKNLVENAIQHSPAASAVRIVVDEQSITVRDWGCGVDAEQRSRMFERFWRGPHRRDQGAGLGLAICMEIARSHGWVLTAEPASPGLKFVLSSRVDTGTFGASEADRHLNAAPSVFRSKST